MTINDGNGAGLIAFLDWAGSRGELAPATARAYAAAVRRVLAVEPGAEGRPVAEIDVDNLLDRFETLARTDFTAASMTTYKSRFRQSIAMYVAWLAKDQDWKNAGRTPTQQRAAKAAKAGAVTRATKKQPSTAVSRILDTIGKNPVPDPAPDIGAPRLVSYDLPLRPDLLVRLALPVDLTKADAARISAFVGSLAFDGGSAPASGSSTSSGSAHAEVV